MTKTAEYTTYNPPKGALAFRKRRNSLAKKLTDELTNINTAFNEVGPQKIELVDAFDYLTHAAAAAAWVSSNASATTGVVVTSEFEATSETPVNYVEGTDSMIMTVGSGTLVATNVVYTYSAPQDWREFNYLGFSTHYEGAGGTTRAAVDWDVILTDEAGLTATTSLPVTALDDAWFIDEVDFNSATLSNTNFKWSAIKTITLAMSASCTAGDIFTIDEMLLYRISNGHGPALGTVIKALSGEDTLMVRGAFAQLGDGMAGNFVTADAGEVSDGIVCLDADAGEETLIQINGPAIVQLGANLTSAEAGDWASVEDASGLYVKDGSTAGISCGHIIKTFKDDIDTDLDLIWITVGSDGEALS